MKIAVTARLLGGRLEGIGQYTYELLSRLVVSYPEDEWHIIYDRQDDRLLIKGNNVVHHFIGPQTRHPWLIRFWLDYSLVYKLNKIKPDVLWCPDGLLSLRTKILTVLTIHDLAFIEYPQGNRDRDLRFYKKRIPLAVNRADIIITISNYTKNSIIKNYNIDTDKIAVIYNACSSKFKPLIKQEKIEFRKNYTNKKPYFLYLGAIHPRKNVKRIILAFEKIKKEGYDYKLVIAGRMAWHSKNTQDVIRHSDYSKDIICLDQLDHLLYDLVGSAAALCNLSLVEGFGLPVLEAMTCGVPVITSKDSAMSEVCGEASIVCDPLDIEGIANAMKRIHVEEEAQCLATLGLKRAQEFNWDKACDEVYGELEKVKA